MQRWKASDAARGCTEPCAAATQVRDGTLYDGVFSGLKSEGAEVGVLLKMARALEQPSGTAPPPAAGFLPELYIQPDDLVQANSRRIPL